MDIPLIGEPASEKDNYPVINGLHRQWCAAEESQRPAIEEDLYRALNHYAVRLCASKYKLCDADLSSLATSKALEGMATYKGTNGAKFTTWAHRVLMNTFIDDLIWRRKWLGQELRMEEHDVEDQREKEKEEAITEAQIKVHHLMRIASPLQRELLEAWMSSDSLQGAADRIGISKSAAQSRLESFRAVVRRKGIEFKSRLSLYKEQNSPSYR